MVRTNLNGEWHFDALSKGKHTFEARKFEFSVASPVEISLDGNARSGVVLRTETGGTIRGTVVDSTGRGIDKAIVVAASDSVSASQQTTTSGDFSLDDLEKGDYRIYAMHNNLASHLSVVHVGSSPTSSQRLLVEDASLAGIVTSQDGVPVSNLQVSVRSEAMPGEKFPITVTDQGGRFDFGGLPAGRYMLSARRSDNSYVTTERIVASAGDRSIRIVVVESAAIVGRVIMGNMPVPYFGVILSKRVEAWREGPPAATRSARGEFRRVGLEPGHWTVAIVGPGFVPMVLPDVEVVDGKSTDLGSIVVTQGELLHGHVVDSDGQRVVGATVILSNESGLLSAADTLRQLAHGRITTVTDARGEFLITGISQSGDNRISAQHPTLGSSKGVYPNDGEIEIQIEP